jgi:hypothetical protein
MELLDIYQDLLNTQVQTPEPVESATDEFEEANDRKLVHSLINRLNGHLPPEPGTSQSHTLGIDLQQSATGYRHAVSQLAVVLQDPDTVTVHPDPSPPVGGMKHQILPSPLEWAALIRECVSTLQVESPMD